MKTKREIEYRAAPYPGVIAVIPQGTEVYLASNLPHPPWVYWAHEWEGMTEEAESWMNNYGFMIYEDDIEAEFSDRSNYGRFMTLSNFKASVEAGLFIDYDGFGNLATSRKESDYEIKPSHIKGKRPLPRWATHVVWYNR